MAVSLEDYFTLDNKNDTAFVKWFAIYYVYSDDEVIEKREVPMYPCRDEDYQKFYPTDNKSKRKLDAIRS